MSLQLKKFGANVRRERTGIGMTQEKLAELADLNIRTVQKIEAGNINILVTTLFRLQRALHCEWDRLLFRK
jgi:transcriptional regulator with XRE-family HTH domain